MYTETMIIFPANENAAAYLKAEGFIIEAMENSKMSITTDKYTVDNEPDALVRELVDLIGTDCTIEGYYDVYEYSGYSKKFSYVCENGNVKKYASCWFSSLNANSYDDYEEFCDTYYNDDDEPLYTEEQYASFCDGEWFALDDGSNDVVTAEEIPMNLVAEEQVVG